MMLPTVNEQETENLSDLSDNSLIIESNEKIEDGQTLDSKHLPAFSLEQK